MTAPGNTLAAAVAPSPLVVDIRAPLPDERAYCLGSWSEAYHAAPRMGKLPWAVYKQHVVPELGAVLDRSDTRVLVADLDGLVAGWIAFVPGRRVSTVHWIHTRFRIGKDGALLRRRGVMRRLLDAAQLGARLVYTHRGPYPRHRGEQRQTSDEWIVRWLAGRGVTAAFVSMEDWKK